MASPAREYRVLGLVQVAIGFTFLIAAGVLNPLEAAIGMVVMTPAMFATIYFAVARRNARAAIATAAPTPTVEREEPGALTRRIAWPVAGEIAVMLLLAGIGHAPGLMAGVAFGVGLALLLTSRLIERWEVAHSGTLLRDPGTRRYYVARER
jgi:hypothetical protein